MEFYSVVFILLLVPGLLLTTAFSYKTFPLSGIPSSLLFHNRVFNDVLRPLSRHFRTTWLWQHCPFFCNCIRDDGGWHGLSRNISQSKWSTKLYSYHVISGVVLGSHEHLVNEPAHRSCCRRYRCDYEKIYRREKNTTGTRLRSLNSTRVMSV